MIRGAGPVNYSKGADLASRIQQLSDMKLKTIIAALEDAETELSGVQYNHPNDKLKENLDTLRGIKRTYDTEADHRIAAEKAKAYAKDIKGYKQKIRDTISKNMTLIAQYTEQGDPASKASAKKLIEQNQILQKTNAQYDDMLEEYKRHLPLSSK